MTSTMPRASGKRGSQSYLPSRWVALALLASAQLMLVLDVTVVNVALPDIGVALHLQRGELPWVMTIYTVFFGGLMLLGGRIADLFGARRMTLGGLALFTAASLMCGLSGNAATLLAGRSLQGLGAALMSPAALAAVMTLFTGASRGKALGVWSALAGVGSALGVVLGGVLTSEAGWRWVFTINVPIGAALLIAIPLAVPARPPSEPAERGLDVPGAALGTAGTPAALYRLVNVGSHGRAAPSPAIPPRPHPGGRRIYRRGRLDPARGDGDRAEHRRPRDRGDVRHRLHGLAHRRRPGRRRPAISASQHVPRTRRCGRGRRLVQRRGGRP